MDADQVQTALLSLPSWSGDTERLVREVLANAETTALLRAQVATAANEADHHPLVEDVDGGTRFVVWTHSAGGVTAKDTALAARIDAIVSALNL
jgi:4a-hydroxytetrahydrobiopterin dehydratase